MPDPIDDILNRQRNRAKQNEQEQKDAEEKARDQQALAELWNNVRDFDGNDADSVNEWVAFISALTLSLDERGLMGRLEEPPSNLGKWNGNEPDGYHLAAEIFRQSLIDRHKAVGLLLEAGKLRETIWPRVNEWLRRELREHIEGRWDSMHTRPTSAETPATVDAIRFKEPSPHTLGWLIGELENSEKTKEWIEKEYEREEATYGKIGADGWRFRAEAYGLFHPDPSTMPGLDRIEHLCDAEFNGSGLTVACVRQLRVKICKKLKWDSEKARCADGLSLIEAADVLEGKQRIPWQIAIAATNAAAKLNKVDQTADVPLDQSTIAAGEAAFAFVDSLAGTNTTMRTLAVDLGIRHAGAVSLNPNVIVARKPENSQSDDATPHSPVGDASDAKYESQSQHFDAAPGKRKRKNPNAERDEWIRSQKGTDQQVVDRLRAKIADPNSDCSTWKPIGKSTINEIRNRPA
jgi:hypothetical protein